MELKKAEGAIAHGGMRECGLPVGWRHAGLQWDWRRRRGTRTSSVRPPRIAAARVKLTAASAATLHYDLSTAEFLGAVVYEGERLFADRLVAEDPRRRVRKLLLEEMGKLGYERPPAPRAWVDRCSMERTSWPAK